MYTSLIKLSEAVSPKTLQEEISVELFSILLTFLLTFSDPYF